jgi:hypothetical protein
MKRVAMLWVALGLLAAVEPLRAQDDVVLRAMRDELARSVRELRLDTMPAPYFIAYRVDETSQANATGMLGSLLGSGESRSRRLTVELRVGDYAFDNTNYAGMPSVESFLLQIGGMRQLPLDTDYVALRRQLWLATDAAYKNALDQIARKRAALQDQMRADYVPDFSREDVATSTDEVAAPPPDRRSAERLVLGLSALFKDTPAILRSTVACRATVVRTRYVNSEGTSFTRVSPTAAVTVTASTQASDGRPLSDGYQTFAPSQAQLLPPESLAAAVRALGARLTRLTTAPAAEAYTGPVLFEGEAAAALFGRVFAPQLAASRRPTSDNPMMERMLSGQENPFLDQIGGRVLPRWLSVTANPTLATYEGRYTGGFRVDDDGVPARETRLVDHGILRALLATRVPVRHIAKSTGNRLGGGAAAGTLIVSTDSGLSDAALHARLLELAASRGNAYAIVVRRLLDPSLARADDPMARLATLTGSTPGAPSFAAADVVKLFPDGHEEPIRNADISGISTQTFREIVAASAGHTVVTAAGLGIGGAGSAIASILIMSAGALAGPGGPTTYVMPSLLFEDVTLRPEGGEAPKLPVLSPPWVH